VFMTVGRDVSVCSIGVIVGSATCVLITSVSTIDIAVSITSVGLIVDGDE
jgi:hypothetical protein